MFGTGNPNHSCGHDHAGGRSGSDSWMRCATGGIHLHVTGVNTRTVDADVKIFGAQVLRGYKTDGASVPRWLQFLIPRFGRALPAAIVHDMRYDPPCRGRWMTRRTADREFRTNLKTLGVMLHRRWLAWAGLSLFGWYAWHYGERLNEILRTENH